MEKYRENTQNSDQMVIKYIVLPDINDRKDDFVGIISLLNHLEVPQIILSRDVHMKFSNDMEYHEKLINGVSRLKQMCENKGIRVSDDWKFTPKERREIEARYGI